MTIRGSSRLLLILDYDGTLCSTRSAIVEALGRVFDGRSIPRPSAESLSALVGSGITVAETLRRLHPAHPNAADRNIEAMVSEYRSAYADIANTHVTLFPGVRRTLDALRDVATIVVASNKGAAAVNASLAHFGLQDIVSLVIADEQGLPLKPDARMLHERITPHFPWTKPQGTIVVGDTEADLHFANAAGVTACWAAYGYGDEQRCTEAGFHYRIETFSDLTNVVAEHDPPGRH